VPEPHYFSLPCLLLSSLGRGPAFPPDCLSIYAPGSPSAPDLSFTLRARTLTCSLASLYDLLALHHVTISRGAISSPDLPARSVAAHPSARLACARACASLRSHVRLHPCSLPCVLRHPDRSSVRPRARLGVRAHTRVRCSTIHSTLACPLARQFGLLARSLARFATWSLIRPAPLLVVDIAIGVHYRYCIISASQQILRWSSYRSIYSLLGVASRFQAQMVSQQHGQTSWALQAQRPGRGRTVRRHRFFADTVGWANGLPVGLLVRSARRRFARRLARRIACRHMH
jgi:hypothetical protein